MIECTLSLWYQHFRAYLMIEEVTVTGYNGLVVDTGKDPIRMKITLQEQLVNLLTNYIKDLPADTKLPSERQLSDKYQLSRNTVRAALLELEITGMVRRIHGKGTFVNEVNPKSDLSNGMRFSNLMQSVGKTPRTKILSFEFKEIDESFFKNLDVDLGRFVIKIQRLHIADDVPILLERSYLPYARFNKMTRKMIEGKSLYQVIAKKFDEKVSYADEYFSAGLVSSNDSKLLAVAEGTPCQNIQRKTYNQRNQLVELTLSVARSDQFAYHIRHNVDYE